MEIFITRLIVFILCFACMDIIREFYSFIQCFIKVTPYKITNTRMIALWLSLSYVITIILTGLI